MMITNMELWKIVYKGLLQFVLGTLSSFILGFCMWIARELIAHFDILWKYKISSFILNYDHFLLFIIHLGLPLGAILGIIIVDRLIFKLPTYSLSGIMSGFLCGVAGTIFILWLLPLTKIDITKFIPFFSSFGYDAYVFLLPILVGVLSVIGYRIAMYLK